MSEDNPENVKLAHTKTADSHRDVDAARRKAQNHFAASEARTALVKDIVAGERAALDAKTAKLRALRLAKEEADRKAALANPSPPASSKTTRTRTTAKAASKTGHDRSA